jgi:hypothetical protein
MSPRSVVQVVFSVSLVACATVAGPSPVLPPIHDQTIVFGQRVGPVSLGMNELQLFDAVGKTSATAYGGNRVGYLYADLKLNVVVDAGRVVAISPTDGSYATATGIRIGSSERLVTATATVPTRTQHPGATNASYCLADHTLVTVGVSQSSACSTGEVCDIVIGGCTPH